MSSTASVSQGSVRLEGTDSQVESFDLKGIRIAQVARTALYVLTIALAAVTVGLAIGFALSQAPLTALVVSGVALGILLSAQIVKLVNPYLPQKVQQGINLIRATVVDLFAVLGLVILYPILQTRYDPKKYVDDNQPPILLIHGYLHNSSGWAYHKYQYKKAGYRNVFTVDLGHPLHSIEEYAQVVQKKVNEIKALTGKSDVRLVGHSMGGVVAAYYATHLASNDGTNVSDLVTLGSPLQGTRMAVIGIGQCAKQMRFGSSFITDLSQKLKASGIRCFHQGSESDLIIYPSASTVNGEKKAENPLYKDMGHGTFLFSDRVIRRTLLHFRSSQASI